MEAGGAIRGRHFLRLAAKASAVLLLEEFAQKHANLRRMGQSIGAIPPSAPYSPSSRGETSCLDSGRTIAFQNSVTSFAAPPMSLRRHSGICAAHPGRCPFGSGSSSGDLFRLMMQQRFPEPEPASFACSQNPRSDPADRSKRLMARPESIGSPQDAMHAVRRRDGPRIQADPFLGAIIPAGDSVLEFRLETRPARLSIRIGIVSPAHIVRQSPLRSNAWAAR